MSLCSLSYLGGVLDRASAISCGSDAVTCPVTGRIINFRMIIYYHVAVVLVWLNTVVKQMGHVFIDYNTNN